MKPKTEGRASAGLVLALASLLVPLAWAEDGRVGRRDRAARLARTVLPRAVEPARYTTRDGEFDVRVYVSRDAAGAIAWVDVLDARASGDPLGALLAHRSERVNVRDASL